MDMKRVFCFAIMLSCITSVFPQEYTPNTKWPYLYEDFTFGTVFFADSSKFEAELNVHLQGNRLHYISKEGKVLVKNRKDIVKVVIGEDNYVNSDFGLVKIIASKDSDYLFQVDKADFEALISDNGGAYGSSLNSSAITKLTSLELGGLNNSKHALMLQEKYDGKDILIKKEYYFFLRGKQLKANKKSIEGCIKNEILEELELFIKKNRIKWKKKDALVKLFNYLTSNQQLLNL